MSAFDFQSIAATAHPVTLISAELACLWDETDDPEVSDEAVSASLASRSVLLDFAATQRPRGFSELVALARIAKAEAVLRDTSEDPDIQALAWALVESLSGIELDGAILDRTPERIANAH